ncbi:hypothetical protein BHU72_07770 [Desulfuribacillus stibiiarsenatis]|uniref:Septum formation initiator n=1 Tax=Desulfuribacillus stibiiarsenatis TaxID=1390249 RepID=A0A1E5L3K5_9FIRM|nr:DivIVA domain-containing protein [Desulfuribacillus stibiiarsenatis]OEH84725.1 hypothetical protein BHU72_07770 [Desulfuribacillus stibiiarsenatis]
MALTPLDISNKDFSRALRGYDIDEVNEFLDHVIKDFEALIKENRQLNDKLATLEEKQSHFEKLEDNLKKTIVVAHETSEEVRGNAKKEAKLIIREAEKNADRIINEAVMKSHKSMMEVQDLKNQAKVYRIRLKSLIEAQLELIDSGDWDDLDRIGANQEDND